jgi:protocatechuate 3,4-dioxygenase beta subunit
VGSPLSLLEFIFVPLLIYLLFRISRCWGRKPVKGKMVEFAILLALQLFCQYQGACAYSSAQERSLRSKEAVSLRIVSEALAKYHQSHSAYPSSLGKLVPEQLDRIPTSAFGKEYPPHYVVLDDQRTSSTGFWLIWFPGPDRKYDIQEGPELKTAMQRLAERGSSPWLTDLAFDPTNGTLSRGDMYRYKETPHNETPPGVAATPAREPAIDKRPLDSFFADLPRSNANGTIVDQSGRSVPDADVFLYYSHGPDGARDRLAGRTKSGPDGRFEFRQAMVWEPVTEIQIEEPPKYVLLARHPSLGMNCKILLRGEPTEGIHILLLPGRSADILLRDPAGRPIAEARVYLHSGDESRGSPFLDPVRDRFILYRDIGVLSGESDSEGRIQVPMANSLPEMGLTVEKDGFVTTRLWLSYDYMNRDYVLYPSAWLEGVVTWPDGSPASDIAVYCRYWSSGQGTVTYSTLTDSAGHYCFPNMPANGFNHPSFPVDQSRAETGQVYLWIEDLRPDSRCLPAVQRNLSFEPRRRYVHDFRLRPAYIVGGTVFDEATSRTVPNMNITYIGSSYPDGQIKTDEHGRFRIRVEKNSWLHLRLHASSDGQYLIDWPPGCERGEWTKTFERVSGDVSDLTIKTRLCPLAPLKGRVIGADGLGVGNAGVQVDFDLPGANTDPQGCFSLKAAPADRDFDILAIERVAKNKRTGLARVGKGTHEVTIQLEPENPMTGVIVDQDGALVPGFPLLIHPILNGYPEYYETENCKSGPDGKFTVSANRQLSYLARWNACWNGNATIQFDTDKVKIDFKNLPPNAPFRVTVHRYAQSISGRVVDARGTPIPNAFISSDKAPRPNALGVGKSIRLSIGADGLFSIPFLDRSEFTLKVRAEGYKEKEFKVRGGQSLMAVLEPYPKGPRQYIFTVTNEKSRPVQGASVSLQWLDFRSRRWNPEAQEARTDAHGKAAISLTLPNEISPERLRGIVKCEAKGYGPLYRGLQLSRDSDVQLALHKPGLPYRGRVLDINNRPIAGAKVVIRGMQAPGSKDVFTYADFLEGKHEATSGRDGRFVLGHFTQPDLLTADVSAAGYESEYFGFSPDRPEALVKLTLGGSVRGRVIIASGEPIASGSLGVSLRDYFGPNRHFDKVGIDGSYLIKDVKPGTYTIWCQGMEIEPEPESLLSTDVEQGPNVTIEAGKISEAAPIRMTRLYRVRGRIVDAETGRVPAGELRISKVGDRLGGIHDVKADGTCVMYLPEGENRIEVRVNNETQQVKDNVLRVNKLNEEEIRVEVWKRKADGV